MTGATGAPRAPRTVAALFALYLVLLVWLVLWKLHVPHVGGEERVLKLIPFVASGGAGASRPGEVAANVLVFVPFGVYASFVAPRWSWRRLTAVAAAVSIALEAAQWVLAVGRSDATDVVANAAGALLGIGLVALAHRAGTHAGRVVVAICTLGTVLAVVAGVMLSMGPRGSAPDLPTRGLSSLTHAGEPAP